MAETHFALLRHDGETFVFGEEGISIGRSQTNGIVIPHASVSREHARILVTPGQCWLRDQNSAGGILVNNRRVAGQQAIHVNDVITIGNNSFRLILAQSAQRRSVDNVQQPSPSSGLEKKFLPLIIGGALVLIIGLVMIFSGGIDLGGDPSDASTGSDSSNREIIVDPRENAVSLALSALEEHRNFDQHVAEYRKTADTVNDYITFEAEAQSIINTIDLLKTYQIWGVMVSAADLYYPGGGAALEMMDDVLRNLVKITANLDRVSDLEETRSASQSFISNPSWAALLDLEKTTPNSKSALIGLKSDLAPILTQTSDAFETLQLAFNAADEVSSTINNGTLSSFTQGIDNIIQPVQDLYNYINDINRSINTDLDLMERIQSITNQAR
jgi:pSer/pThr/pTyr-binding forkhead associated (FHA) protein